MSSSTIRRMGGGVRAARRCLFGRSSGSETEAWLEKVSAALRVRDELLWNFSFSSETPLPSPTATFCYELLPAQCLPSFYRFSSDLSSPSSSSPSSSSSTSSSNSPSTSEEWKESEWNEERADASLLSLSTLSSLSPSGLKSIETPKKRQIKITRFFTESRKKQRLSSGDSRKESASIPVPLSTVQVV